MIGTLITTIHQANPDYIVEFEEAKLVNVKIDDYVRSSKFAYIEEYISGKIEKSTYGRLTKKQTIQIYFCRFCEMHNTAFERETIRTEIFNEIVQPFMVLFEKIQRVPNWVYNHPTPRFDANEVSVMLEFEVESILC